MFWEGTRGLTSGHPVMVDYHLGSSTPKEEENMSAGDPSTFKEPEFNIISMDWNSFEPSNSGQIIYQTVNPPSNVQPQAMDYFWTVNVNSVLLLQSHQKMTISKFGSTDPSKAGFVRTYLEESEKQIGDYRRTLPDGRGIHIREFSDRYVIHWDKVCPLANPIEHINQDTQYGPALSVLVVGGGITLFAIALFGGVG